MTDELKAKQDAADREELDTMWQQALIESVKDGEQFTRYHFANLVAAAECEACANAVERARLHMDGSLGLTHETDFIATRITDFLAAQIRNRGEQE